MHQTFVSVEDNILHYVYFNKHCSLPELEKQIIYSPLTRKSTVLYSILNLEKEKLVSRRGEKIEITEEGKIAVESYHSYEDYVAAKKIT